MTAKVPPLVARALGAQTHHPIFAVCAVLLGPFMVGFHSRLFSTGLADLRGAFDLSFDEGAWLNTISTAPQMLAAPAVAWLAATFGVRRVMVPPALLYAIVSAVIPTVTDFRELAVLHFIHGLLLGIFVPATLMIIFRNLPLKWWTSAIAIYAFRAAFTTNAGTGLLDFYIQNLGWKAVYWQDVLLAPIMAILVLLGSPREEVNRGLLAQADWGGMLLLGCGMSLIFVGLDQGNRLDWLESGFVQSCLAGGAVLLLAFFINESLVKQPWASASVLYSRNLILILTIALFYLISSLSNAALIPNFLSTVALLRPQQTGDMLIVWACIPLLIMTPICVWALNRIDGRIVLLIGLTCFALSGWLGTRVTADWTADNFRLLAVLQGCGHILTFLPIIVLAVANSNPAKSTSFAAYIQVIRLLGTEMALTLMTTFLRKQEQIHSFLLTMDVPTGAALTTDRILLLTRKFAAFGQGLASSRALSTFNQALQKQSNVLSYIDAFWITFFAAIVAMLLLAFMRPAPAGPFTPQGRQNALKATREQSKAV
ncbi:MULTISPECIES: MFS transporter [Rhizobium]|uniref:Major facilitator superfamily (MFS) profile domain-containing protein n=1 Tax=Rhizobium rhizogenes (strain K84 / ATCC BAA-868) TaxID=311403 RepID=B9JMK6_RHIR8|nr:MULTISPECIES: MFS transporter [Rhizobium]ACM28787.1 conserved hypothetical protein [Rhizobium rhizogenes K84]EJK88084.1 arabinose efflux permease family protein [Rhizobium sp. AP16]NTI43779.1 MFS transporter [Rhizobium rhizogenes]OCJ18950.1 arabinose ABC transporter permease [Agrobacterium sp. B131/95]